MIQIVQHKLVIRLFLNQGKSQGGLGLPLRGGLATPRTPWLFREGSAPEHLRKGSAGWGGGLYRTRAMRNARFRLRFLILTNSRGPFATITVNSAPPGPRQLP